MFSSFCPSRQAHGYLNHFLQVETESSVFNNRIIMLGLIVTGAVAYGLIRHRMNMKQGMPKTK